MDSLERFIIIIPMIGKSREENLTNKEIAQQLHISEKTLEGQIT